MTGRRTEPVPVREGTTPEEVARVVALIGFVCLLPLAVVDWVLGTVTTRVLVCSAYGRGGVLDCGGSAGFGEAMLTGTLLGLLLVALQTWLLARVVRRVHARGSTGHPRPAATPSEVARPPENGTT
ncbi:hypothetical protein [Microtetraspora fusca]|uniref:hypothetical protein n=1 Tax=Microtetraspora fusca TaxID=1997 RepID=UPI00082ED95D|nr:hypothetical protein [Microtetraspora fusca]